MSISEQQLASVNKEILSGVGLRNRTQKPSLTKNLLFAFADDKAEVKTKKEYTVIKAHQKPQKPVIVSDSMFDKRDEVYYKSAMEYLKQGKQVLIKDAASKLKKLALRTAKNKAISMLLNALGIPTSLFMAVSIAMQFSTASAQSSNLGYFFGIGHLPGEVTFCGPGNTPPNIECEEYYVLLNGLEVMRGSNHRYPSDFDNSDKYIDLPKDYCKQIFNTCRNLSEYNRTLSSMFSESNSEQYLNRSNSCPQDLISFDKRCQSMSTAFGLSSKGCLKLNGQTNPEDTSKSVQCIQNMYDSFKKKDIAGIAILGTIGGLAAIFACYCICQYLKRKRNEASAGNAAVEIPANADRKNQAEEASRQIPANEAASPQSSREVSRVSAVSVDISNVDAPINTSIAISDEEPGYERVTPKLSPKARIA